MRMIENEGTVRRMIPDDRAEKRWPRLCKEIHVDALLRNVEAFREKLREGCEIMAVVKANAYGHGDRLVAKILEKNGVRAFAVAALPEARRLREAGIRGDILILGYTGPEEAEELIRYDLIQTVVSPEHGEALQHRLSAEGAGNSSSRLRVHIKLDTGMHRNGIDVKQYDAIRHMFELDHLGVEGMFSHLGVSDSRTSADEAFTNRQISAFFETTDRLKADGLPTGRLHIHATYGILNYGTGALRNQSDQEGRRCDYVRIGIGLYGVLDQEETLREPICLQPVLSLRAGTALIRHLNVGEAAGYGRAFRAKRETELAVVTCGYADGIPRNLAEGGGCVLVRGKRVPIVGRICMDQMIVDVTGIEGVREGDAVTLIGRDGAEEICCEEVAAWGNTISNEILSRLSGNRAVCFPVSVGRKMG